MRTALAIVTLLCFAFSSVRGGSQPNYTTLIIEFVGEMDKPVFPIVISTSSGEAEWYRQNLFQGSTRIFANVDVMSASALKEIAELPVLKRALENARPTDDREPKSTPTVRFTAGVGHDHTQIMLEAQTSAKILVGIDSLVAQYPALQSQIQEVESRIKSATVRNR